MFANKVECYNKDIGQVTLALEGVKIILSLGTLVKVSDAGTL